MNQIKPTPEKMARCFHDLSLFSLSPPGRRAG
jgi:hypothetical protein